ncbi:MAG: rRNA maturation RNase YbeY [Propionibacteriaceae bacterium]|jgi:probable rRNA maturation factor|nr:rRNA maturation RNase YbeY [Propionibacteriaceae bacterium]
MIEVNNESGLPVDELRFQRLAAFVLAELSIHPQADLSILFVDKDTMANYNEKFMGHEGPTDVLSFPMDELRVPGPGEQPPLGLLGDIVLAPEVTDAQAAEHNRTPAQEADYLLIHGLLHLLGYDHAETEEAVVMFGLNDRLYNDWNKIA